MTTLMKFEESLARVRYLQSNLRLLAAREAYDHVESMIQHLNDENNEEYQQIQQKWNEFHENREIGLIKSRSEEIQKIIHDCSETLDGWTLGSEMFGITTYYRIEEDGMLAVRMEGVQEIPIFEQLAVLYEVSLFNQWIPFCSQSELLHQISLAEMIWYAKISTPLAVRDMVVHVYAVDCTIESGCVAFSGHSFDPSTVPDVEVNVPPEPSIWSGYRMNVKQLCGVMNIISPTTAKTVIISKMDIKLALPQTVINFIMRNIAGMFLYVLQQQSLKAANDPNNIHAVTIRQKPQFYVDFMLANVRAYCQHRGWDQVTIAVLGEMGIPQDGTDYSKALLY